MTRKFEKPTVLLSNCIEHEACRYDGTMIRSNIVKKLMPYVSFLTVCPETAIGLPIPRQTLRIIKSDQDNRLVFSKTGEDITDNMQYFIDGFMEKISNEEIHGAILKSRSPSCGIKDVKAYKSFGKSPCLEKTKGLFAASIIDKYSNLPIEDEGRLTNYNIREHFFTRIFTLAHFDHIKKLKKIDELIKFQSENKYMLMAHSPGNLKILGKLTANNMDLSIEEILEEYEYYLKKALSNRPSTMRNVNMLLHLFGYFSKYITKDEKVFFLDSLESYGNRKVPFSVPLAIIHSWVIRFDNEYLLNQTIFESFPSELIQVSDSGKGV